MDSDDEHELVPETPSADERGGSGFFSLSRLPIAPTPRFVSNLIGANMSMLFGCSPNSDPHATPSAHAKRVPIERSNSNTHSRAPPPDPASISVSIPLSADVSVDLADAPVDVSMEDIAVEDARPPHRRENAVKVFLRQRPSSPQLARAIHIPSNASTKCKSVSFRPVSFNSTQSDAEAVYTFDHVFRETADNEEVFRTTTLPLLVHLFDEPTPTDELILAYGPSGSGKTHTLSAILNKSIAFLVNRVNSLGLNSSAPSNIVPLHWGQVDVLNIGSADEEFGGASTGGEGSCSLWISFLEIHNDRCRDLLNPASVKGSGTKMNLDASTETPYFKNMTEYRITDLKSGVDIVNKVISARRTQETNVNKTSSRGHLITTIKLLRFVDAKSKPRISRISIADLAGSENSKKTGAEGATLSEAGHINKSLLFLSDCVNKMVKNQKSHSAFEREKRESNWSCQLTKSLQPFFRTGLVTFLFHIDPTNEDQTKAVLEFSHQTCQLVTFQPFSPTMKRKRGGDAFRSDARGSGDAEYSAAQVAAELRRMCVRATCAERERDTLALKNRELEAVLSEMEAQMRGLVENEGRRMKEGFVRIVGDGDSSLREARARIERDCLEKMERRFKVAKGLLEMADELKEELGMKEIELEQKDNEVAQLQEMYDARETEILSLEDQIQVMTEKQGQDRQLIEQLQATREMTFSETVFRAVTADAETQAEIHQESECEPRGGSYTISVCDAVENKTGISIETQTDPAAAVSEKKLYENSETQTDGCFDSSQGSSNPSDQPLSDSQITLTCTKSFDKNEHEEIEDAEDSEPALRRSRRISGTSLIPASDKSTESGEDLKRRRRSIRSSQSSPPVSASRRSSKRRAFGFAAHEHNGNVENEDTDGSILHDESKKLDHPKTKASTTADLKLSFTAKTIQNPGPVSIPVGTSRRTRALIGALQAGSRKPLDAVVGDGGVSASVSLSASIQKISVGVSGGVGGSNGSILQPVSRQRTRGSASVGGGKWGGLLRLSSSGVDKESETVSDETPEIHIEESKVDEPVEEGNHKKTRKLRTEKAMMPEDSPMPAKRRRRNVRK
ncbi:P-loop containing nucleoside triphosphate hydrolase protein [Chytriomyces cf. hyalinus JEL632]|nr:P-loop containing nucleoside triphosphate hydrolase protein [Chytriomyces cf. hyalinus JEL632]